MQILPASSIDDLDMVRMLLREYHEQLGVNLAFQGFEAELAALPGAYTAPGGCLLLAKHEGAAVGCIALRATPDGRAEMKRLYVRAEARGLGVGRALVARVLDAARAAGYAEIVLDTLPTMTAAQGMYLALGFREIPAYTLNPVPGARFLGLRL